MWQKLTKIEIENKHREENRPKLKSLNLWKILGAAILIGTIFSFLEILTHKYWFGNNGGKTFRLPWYDLSEHTLEISLTFIICFALAVIIGVIAHFFDDPRDKVPTYICLKCQNVQGVPSMCEICKSHKLLDFWYVKWVEPHEQQRDTRKEDLR